LTTVPTPISSTASNTDCPISRNDPGTTFEKQRKEHLMCDHQHNTRSDHTDALAVGISSDWAHRATSDRVAQWSSDRIIDPGDTHDKGEPSLCVGEAA
jgi:hypothetical protein